MLTDYFSCDKLNNRSNPFHEKKNSPKLIDCQIFDVFTVLGYSNNWVHKVHIEQKLIVFNLFNLLSGKT